MCPEHLSESSPITGRGPGPGLGPGLQPECERWCDITYSQPINQMSVEEIQSSVVFKNTATINSSPPSSPSSSSSKRDSKDEKNGDSDSEGSFETSSDSSTSACSAGELARSTPYGGGHPDEEEGEDEDDDQFDNTNSLNRFQDLDSRRRLYERNRSRSTSSSSVNESSRRGGSSVQSGSSSGHEGHRFNQTDLKILPTPQVLLRLQLDLRDVKHIHAGKEADCTESSKTLQHILSLKTGKAETGTISVIWNMRDSIKYVQNMLAWLLDLLESTKNIFNWTIPSKVP